MKEPVTRQKLKSDTSSNQISALSLH